MRRKRTPRHSTTTRSCLEAALTPIEEEVVLVVVAFCAIGHDEIEAVATLDSHTTGHGAIVLPRHAAHPLEDEAAIGVHGHILRRCAEASGKHLGQDDKVGGRKRDHDGLGPPQVLLRRSPYDVALQSGYSHDVERHRQRLAVGAK